MLFAEVVKHGLAVSRRSVKRALRRLGCAVVVFHVIGKIMNWVMLMKRRNLGFFARLPMRSRSSPMPPLLLGFLTSIKTKGMPFTSRVMSGRNSSSPLMQGNSVTTWKLLLLKFWKLISFLPPD